MTVLLAVTDGLVSNLIAEMIGLVAGAFATYVVIDNLLRRRSRAQNEPLYARLRLRIDQAVAGMAFSWAVSLGMAQPQEALAAARTDYTLPVSERLANSDPKQLWESIRSHDRQGPWLVSEFTVENTESILSLSERLSHLTSNDLTLEELLTDLDMATSDLQLALRHRGQLDDTMMYESEDELLVAARFAFERAVALKTYADACL